MVDNLHKVVALGVATVMALTLTGGAALAQAEDGISPAAIQNLNVQKVDGKSAIGSTGDKNKRKGKLVAFSAQGYLPNNVIKKATDAEKLDGLDGTAYATLAALMSSTGAVNEADNPVHWNQIQGVPPNVLAGDTTRSFIAGESGVIPPAGTGTVLIDHAVGLDVETTLIPTSMNAAFSSWPTGAGVGDVYYYRLSAESLLETVGYKNVGAVASTVKLRVTVWNDNYLSPSAARKLVKVTFIKNPKKALKGISR